MGFLETIGVGLLIVIARAVDVTIGTIRVIGGDEVRTIAAKIREAGLGATVMRGEGRDGERNVLFSFMPKRELRGILPILTANRDRIFYTLDYGGSSNRILLPRSVQPASPRRFFKRK